MGSARPAFSVPPARSAHGNISTSSSIQNNSDGCMNEYYEDADDDHDDGEASGRSVGTGAGSSRGPAAKNGKNQQQEQQQEQQQRRQQPQQPRRASSKSAAAAPPAKLDPSIAAWRETWRKLRTATWSLACDCRRDVSSTKLWGPSVASDLREELQQLAEATQRREQEEAQELARLRAQVKALGPALPFAGSQDRAVALVQGAERQLALLRERQRQEYRELCLEEANLTETLESQFFRFEAWLAPWPSKAIPPVTGTKGAKRDPSAAARCSTSLGAPAPAPASTKGLDVGGGATTSSSALAIRDRIQELSEAIRTASHPSRCALKDEDQDVVRRMLRQWPKQQQVDAALVEELQQLLPQHSFAELQEAAEAAQRCREWQEERRELLAEWKAEQQESKWSKASQRSSSASAGPASWQQNAFRPPSRAGGSNVALEDDELAEELKKREESWAKAAKERERRRQEVLEWKRAKEASKQAELSEEAAKKEAERQCRAQEQRERREAQRSQLEAFRAARAASEAASKDAMRRRSQSQVVTPDVRARIVSRSNALLEKAAREKAIRAEKDRLGGLKSLLEDESLLRPSSGTNSNAFSHIGSKVYEDAERKAADMRSHSVSETDLALQTESGLRTRLDEKIPGSWAHQGILRTTRALPAWRHQFGA